MLQVSHLKKSYVSQLLFEDVTFTLSKGDRVGLVGRNGSGKSTLFKLILGEEEPDEGKIITPNRYRVGGLKQHLTFSKNTVLEECCQALPHHEEHEHYRVEKILSGLGFSQEDMLKSPLVFSGGYQIRISLTKLLVTHPDLLLLDEPTNYLDIVSIRWLKNFLNSFSGEVILITHDRGFMDDVVTHTMGLHRTRLIKVKGNTQKYYQQLTEEEELYEKQKIKQEQVVKHMQNYIDRFRASARRASQAQSRIKKLSRLQQMTELAQEDNLSFSFRYRECPGKTLQEIQNYSFTYPDMDHELIKNFSLFVNKNDRIAIIGKNGAGKSTLLNLLAEELTPQKGTQYKHPQTEIALFGQMNVNRLSENKTIEEEVATGNPDLTFGQVKAICGLMMFERDLSTKKIKVLSGGERSRVLLGKILARQVNLLLLDEPTNHLDQESIEGLLQGLEDFEGAVVLVTHSENILRQFAKKLIVFQNDELFLFEGDYDDFLRRIGWADEANQKQNTPEKNTLSKKEKRQERARIMAEQALTLTPLKHKIQKLEQGILKHEKEVAAITENLIQTSTTQDINKQVSLSKRLKECESTIERLYEELDQVTREYEAYFDTV